MPIPTYNDILEDPEYQNADLAKKKNINENYWKAWIAENPNDETGVFMQDKVISLFDAREKALTADPLSKRMFEHEDRELGTEIGLMAAARAGKYQTTEQFNAAVKAVDEELAPKRKEIGDLLASAQTAESEGSRRGAIIQSIGTGQAVKSMAGKTTGTYEAIRGELNDWTDSAAGAAEALYQSEGDIDKAIAINNKRQQEETDKFNSSLSMDPLNPFGIGMSTAAAATKFSPETTKRLETLKTVMQDLPQAEQKRIMKDAALSSAWTGDTKDRVRKLSTGELVINPQTAFGDKQGLIDEINKSDTTSANKELALIKLDDMRQRMSGKLYRAAAYGNELFNGFQGVVDPLLKEGVSREDALDVWANKQGDRWKITKVGDALAEGIREGTIGISKTIVGTGAGIASLWGGGQTLAEWQQGIQESQDRSEAASQQRGIKGGYSVAKDFANSMTQMAPMFLGAAATGGSATSLATAVRFASVGTWAGAQGYESKLSDAARLEEQRQGRSLSAKEITDLYATPTVQIAALANGIQTAGVNYLMPGGAEAAALGRMTVTDFIAAGGANLGKSAAFKQSVAKALTPFLKHGSAEFVEEFVNQTLDKAISIGALGETMKLGDLIHESLYAGLMGFGMGASLAKLTTHDKTTDELETIANATVIESIAEENLPPSVLGGGTVAPPSAEDVAKLRAERDELASQKFAPGTKRFLENELKIEDIDEQLAAYEEAQVQVREVPVGETAPADAILAEGNAPGTGTAEAEAEAAIAPAEFPPLPPPPASFTAPSRKSADDITLGNLDQIVENGGGKLQVSYQGQDVEFDQFALGINGDEASVGKVKIADRGEASKGLGTVAYIKLGEELAARGITLRSDDSRLASGQALWKRLADQGYAQRKGNGYVFVSKSSQVSPAPETTTTPTDEKSQSSEGQEDAQEGQVLTEPAAGEESPVADVTDEAKALIAKVDAGGVPLSVTPSLERIAAENGIPVTGATTPNEIIQALREKISPAPPVEQPTAPLPEGPPTSGDVGKTVSESAKPEKKPSAEAALDLVAQLLGVQLPGRVEAPQAETPAKPADDPNGQMRLFQLPLKRDEAKLNAIFAGLPKALQPDSRPYTVTNLDTGETHTQNTPIQASDIPPTWDGAQIQITRGESDTLFQSEQQPKGSFTLKSLTDSLIEFYKTADPSTAIHEMAHAIRAFFLDSRVPAAQRYGVTDEDIATVTDWATEGTGKWDRKAEEKWARGVEKFFWEGISTGVKAVDEVLAKLSKWMRDIYQSIKGSDIDIEISPEVRAVMEKLITRGEKLKTEGKVKTAIPVKVKAYTPPVTGGKKMTPTENFSPKNAVSAAVRRKYGLGDRTDPAAQGFDDVLLEAEALLDKNKNAGTELITELDRTGRIATPVELALLMREAAAADATAVYHFNKVADGDTDSITKYNDARIAYDHIITLLENQGTMASRALGFRRILVNRAMDRVKLENQLRADNKGAGLSEEQKKRAADTAEKYKAADAEVNAVAAAKEKARQEDVAKAQIERARKAEEPKTVAKREIEEGKKLLREVKEQGVNLFGRKLFQDGPLFQDSPLTDLDPENLKILVKISKMLVATGNKTVEAFTSALTKEFGPESEPYASALFNKATASLKKAQRSPMEIARDLDPEKDLTGRVIANMVRGHLTLGTKEDEILPRIHEELQQTVWPMLSLDEVREIYTNYGTVTFPSQEEISKKARALKALTLAEIKLEKLLKGLLPESTGAKRDPKRDEVRELEKLITNEYKKLGLKRETETQIKTPLDNIQTRIKNEIKDRQEAIKNRTPVPPKTDPVAYDAETTLLKNELDKVREEYAAIFDDPAATEAQKLARAIKALDRLITKEEEMAAAGILQNPARDAAAFTDPQYVARKQKLDDLREARTEAYLKLHPKKTRAQILHDAALKAQKKGLDRDRQILATGTLPTRRAMPLPYSPSAELQSILSEREALADLIAELRKSQKPAKVPRDRTTQDIKAAADSLAKLDAQILALQTSGTLPVRNTKPGTTNPVLKAIRDARKDRVKVLARLERAARQTKTPREQLQDRRIKALEKDAKKWEDKLAAGDFTRDVKIPEALNAAEQAAKFKRDKVVEEWNRARQADILANASKWEKTKRGIGGAFRLLRLIKLGGNFITLLQGAPFTFRKLTSLQWVSLAKTIGRSLKAGYSEQNAVADYERNVADLTALGFTTKQIRLLSPSETTTAAKEDMPDLDIFKKLAAIEPSLKNLGLPYVVRAARAIEWANQAYLNQARVESAKMMVDWTGRIPTTSELKAIGQAVEVITGRGQVGQQLEQALPWLNNFIFNSVRWNISQFQNLLGYGVWKAPKGTKLKALDQLYIRPKLGYAVLSYLTSLAFAGAGDDDNEEERKRKLKRWFDPRESSFGKVPLPKGGTMDLGQGQGAVLHFIMNNVLGYEIRTGGKKVKLREEWVIGDNDELANEKVPFGQGLGKKDVDFILNRANVVSAAIVRNVLIREQFGGRPATPLSALKDFLTPLIAEDMYEAFHYYGWKGMLLWTESLQGASLNIPPPKPATVPSGGIITSLFSTKPASNPLWTKEPKPIKDRVFK